MNIELSYRYSFDLLIEEAMCLVCRNSYPSVLVMELSCHLREEGGVMAGEGEERLQEVLSGENKTHFIKTGIVQLLLVHMPSKYSLVDQN